MQQSREPIETTVLEVPALPRYARVVRMTAANLASIAGLNVDDVDDVRMAAEEAFVYACATGVSGTLRVEFSIGPDGLAFILEAMCDECVIGDAPDGRMHLYKGIGGEDAR